METTASLPFSINPVNREIDNIEQFQQTLRKLYELNRISTKSPTTLILPSFLTREFELPVEETPAGIVPLLSPQELRLALVSEAERYHVSKTHNIDPDVAYLPITDTAVLYTAYPRQEVEKLQAAFSALGIPLQKIDLNYLAILQGLLPTGYITEQVEQNRPWIFVVVNQTTLFIAQMTGIRIGRITEAPISADDAQAALSEIQTDFNEFTALQVYEKVIIVNNALHQSADSIADALALSVPCERVSQGPDTLRSRGALDGFPCSLEALGGVLGQNFSDLPSINLMRGVSTAGPGVSELRTTAFKILIALNVLVLLLIGVLWCILQLSVQNKNSESQTLATKIADVQTNTSPAQFLSTQRRLYTVKHVGANRTINDLLVYLGAATTRDSWLEEVTVLPGATAEPGGKPILFTAQGESTERASVDVLLNTLRQSLQDENIKKNLMVQSIESTNTEDGQQTYKWIVTNEAAAAQTPQMGGAGG